MIKIGKGPFLNMKGKIPTHAANRPFNIKRSMGDSPLLLGIGLLFALWGNLFILRITCHNLRTHVF